MSTTSITTVITDAGFSLLRAAPGHKLIYTRAVCGSGYVEKTQLATQTEVTDYVMDLSIVEFGPTESAATLRLQLDNSKAPKEFQLYQIGIFAKLLDEEQELIGETLIQIMQYEEPDIVRAVPHVSEFVVNVLLGQAEEVEGIIDMAAYVSIRQFSSRTVNGKPLSADVTLTGEDIKVSDSDPATIKTALSNKADKVKPKRYDFSFSEGFQAYQPCQYWKNEFDEVTIQIGAMKNNVLITSGADAIIGNMPVGFRPKHQIYFPAVAQLSYCTGFINAAGEVVVATKSDIPSGSKFTALTISYLAE